MNERRAKLLRAAAEAFGDGRDPFVHEWLSKNGVTADECMDLSENIGTILFGYLCAPSDLQQRLALLGATAAAGLPAEVVSAADDNLHFSQLTKKLGAGA